jgi:hypothetical protein
VGSSPGTLRIEFAEAGGRRVSVDFKDVAAFSWRERSPDGDEPDELFDATCELFESELLRAHAPGLAMHVRAPVRHLRLNFNAWGTLDVICSGFVVDAGGRQ